MVNRTGEPIPNAERPEYQAGGTGKRNSNHLRIHCVYCHEVFEGHEIVAARAHIRQYHDLAAQTRRERLMDRIERQKTGGGTDANR